MEKLEETTGEQQNIREKRIAQLAPYMYKKGQSGNPSGRPAGISLKEYAKMKLNSMTDAEREEFLEGIDKKTIWEMAENKAKQDTDVKLEGELKSIVINKIYASDNQPSTETN